MRIVDDIEQQIQRSEAGSESCFENAAEIVSSSD